MSYITVALSNSFMEKISSLLSGNRDNRCQKRKKTAPRVKNRMRKKKKEHKASYTCQEAETIQ
jgi:hypothetical protein